MAFNFLQTMMFTTSVYIFLFLSDKLARSSKHIDGHLLAFADSGPLQAIC